MNYLHNIFIVWGNFTVSEFFGITALQKAVLHQRTLNMFREARIQNIAEKFHHHNTHEGIIKIYQTTVSHGTTTSTHIILFYLFCNVIQISSVGWLTRPKVGVTTWPSTILTLNFLRIVTSPIVASTYTKLSAGHFLLPANPKGWKAYDGLDLEFSGLNRSGSNLFKKLATNNQILIKITSCLLASNFPQSCYLFYNLPITFHFFKFNFYLWFK